MPTKKPVKKEAAEKTTLQKEEIKEIVEETVEDTLEKLAEEDTADKKVVEEEKIEKEEKPVTPSVVMPSESAEDEKEVAEETPIEDHEATETAAPVMPEVTAPGASSVEPMGEEKSDQEEGTPATSVTVPVSPSVGPIAEEVPVQPKKKSSLLGIFLLIILLGVLAGGGWYAYTNKMIPTQLFSLAGITGRTAPTSVMQQAPTATPTPVPVDLTKYTISVLNGSGVPGAAAKVKSSLSAAGFTVSNTGNASTSDATDTVIAAKATVSKDYLAKLTEELQKTYSVAATVDSLADSATTDVTVTIGSTTAH